MHHNHRAEKSASRYTEMRFARQAIVLLLHELWKKLKVLTVDGLEQTKIPLVQSQDGVDVIAFVNATRRNRLAGNPRRNATTVAMPASLLSLPQDLP
jgi:hypothetical protein